MNPDNLKPQIVFILGGPGSGKGTQSAIMVEKYGFVHYSTGDLLRQFIQSQSEEAKQIKEMMSEGKLVPSKMLVQIIKHNIFKQGPNQKVYLIDGFPRSEENYQAWEEVFGQSVKVKTLLYLNCQLDTLQQRLLKRGESSGRSDDNITTIRKRFNTYVQQTAPFLQYYQHAVGTVHKIDGEDEIKNVSSKLKDILLEEKLI